MFTTATTALLALVVFVGAHTVPFRIQEDYINVQSDTVRVPVVLGVRSRDRDALLCQSIFDNVLKRIGDKINLSFAYVAVIDESNQDFGVSCQNGFSECAGSVQQLCVHQHTDFSTWWQFVMCQSYEGVEKIGGADLALMCGRSTQIDWDGSGVGKCIGSNGRGTAEEGVALLQQNVRAAQEANIDTSCTVIINNRPVCVHDGMWKGCQEGHTPNDFVRQINAEWNKINTLMDNSSFYDRDE